MTVTGHAIIGTVIAAKIGNPALAIPIALGSHFLADAIPHWDPGYHRKFKSKRKLFTQSFVDLILSFVLAYLLIVFLFPWTNLPYALLIIFVSELPDWITVPYLFLDWDFPPFSSMHDFQKRFDIHLGPPWGIINQVIAVTAVILLGKIL
jgi:hypothetical protein